ncbi:spore coat protein [Clostridium sp.]|uniref:spore coat protein n=1 Tax=Clostridium sp. TaxID=1506 RepID=UPI0015760704|nr:MULTISPECIES: spore coat protein [Clostridium]MBS4842632.1 spore coat protein [Clostridium sp.]MDU1403846.1 spore coat protein [Clostridium sp.]MDU1604838.1 spore coat protein [Clostridium sp.]MDU2896326.1 spore coat protein [Clostridium sp.]MDU3008598.1 spore coat protein [Clostridium sp.]
MRERNLLILILKGEIKINELSLNEYLESKGIIVMGKYFSHTKDFTRKSCENQISTMVELHKLLINCKFNNLNRFGSVIGKELESFKVQLKKIERDYNILFEKNSKNNVEKLFLSEGKRMILQGREAVEYICNNGYLDIIKRSMNREEICIGRADSGNLRKVNGNFEIGIIKGISYNLVEEDLYKYIKRIQKKGIKIDEEEFIRFFVHQSHLSLSSINYLKGLCTYPKDFFKTWERYKENKKNKSEDEFLDLLSKSLKYESKKFI